MKNIMESNVMNKKLIINSNKTIYSTDEICPICGTYQPDGEVCVRCQKEYDTYKPKVHYVEE